MLIAMFLEIESMTISASPLCLPGKAYNKHSIDKPHESPRRIPYEPNLIILSNS